MPVNNNTLHFRKAMEYYGLGWQVIPIPPGRKNPPKSFDLKRWREERITEGQIREWWGSRGIAVILGDVSGGLMCRDYDSHGWYEKWRAGNPKLAKSLPTTKTASGHHVYFRWNTREAAKTALGNREAVAIDPKFGEGELRVKKAYCMLPPSKTEDQKAKYQWEVAPGKAVPEINPFDAGLVDENGLLSTFFGADTETHETHDTQDTQDTQIHNDVLLCGEPACKPSASAPPAPAMVNPEDPMFRDAIMHAISVTSPDYSAGRRRGRAVFDLVRWLSADPVLKEMDARAFREVARLWHNTYQHLLFGNNRDFDVTLDKFLAGWGKVKVKPGNGTVDAAFDAIRDAPIPTDMLEILLTEKKVRLALLCRELQRMNHPGNFFLGIADTVRLLDLDGKWKASQMLNTLQAEGAIKKLKQGALATGEASEFRYLWPT